MGDWEEVIEQLRQGDIDGADAAELLDRKFSGSSLRKRAEGKESLETELADVKAENRRLKTVPKVVEALKGAGVDFEALRPAERKVIDALEYEGDTPSEDWTAKVVADYSFPTTDAGDGVSGSEPRAAEIARTARGAPTGGGSASGVVTPDDFAGWAVEKRLRFIEKYPEAEEALGKGFAMSGIAFS